MNIIAVIPARFGATRFPGKPLARETGKYLVQHVYERAAECARIDRVVVATDDPRIEEAVRSFGGEAVMTRSDHASGTDRVAEAAESLRPADDDVVINVQGDEPELEPSVLNELIDRLDAGLNSRPGALCRIATPAVRFSDAGPVRGPGSPADPNRVKVVLDAQGRALYFSRSLVPFPRQSAGEVDRPSRWLMHLGVYAFRADTLRDVVGLRRRRDLGNLEEVESLEQLRWLAAGFSIGVVLVNHAFQGVDTPEDYASFVARYRDASDRNGIERIEGMGEGSEALRKRRFGNETQAGARHAL
jgi:3-deoxy-manno-octulosonate cytidylyltransferase (CMP-KDO synthetase)